jgi:hypothetical protein
VAEIIPNTGGLWRQFVEKFNTGKIVTNSEQRETLAERRLSGVCYGFACGVGGYVDALNVA